MNDAPIITGLYVPGDRPDRFQKAVDTGAQLVILDLEDAVAPGNKATARETVTGWLLEHHADGGTRFQVRVNAGSGEDLAAVAGLPESVSIRLPKVERIEQLESACRLAGNRGITAIIESALGLELAFTLLSHPAVTQAALGEADLASDLGAGTRQLMDAVRIRVLTAARAAGLGAPMMSVYPDIRNLDGLREDTAHGRSIGLVGRVAVHPSQLAVIREAHRPEPARLEWARQVLQAMPDGGVATLAGGRLVDPAMMGEAEQLLALDAAVRLGGLS